MYNSCFIKKVDFENICENLLTIIIPKKLSNNIKTKTISNEIYGNKEVISVDALFCNEPTNLSRVIAKRIAISYCIVNSFENDLEINMQIIWPHLVESLKLLNEFPLFASVGSQGFISIPIYRQHTHDIKILRLHIWDSSIDKLIDISKISKFSIHSHLFHTTSQILCGEIQNTRIKINDTPQKTGFSEYEIKWINTKNNLDDNNLKSELINTNKLVNVENNIIEQYTKNQRYFVNAGDFHASNYSKDYSVTASIFLFNSKKGRTESSKTIGPKHLIKAPELNYPKMDITPLLDKIDVQLNLNK